MFLSTKDVNLSSTCWKREKQPENGITEVVIVTVLKRECVRHIRNFGKEFGFGRRAKQTTGFVKKHLVNLSIHQHLFQQNVFQTDSKFAKKIQDDCFESLT